MAKGSDAQLKAGLEKLYSLFDKQFLSPDPLECVPKNGSKRDRELAAFIAATFAYGQVNQIVKTVYRILGEMGDKPYICITSGDYKNLFKGFKYRFHKRDDLLWLCKRLAAIYAKHGTLEAAFVASGSNHEERLTGFSHLFAGGGIGQAKKFLVPSPNGSSACKRMNLFLRWMVRQDSLDLGLWKKVKPSELIMPLDVHVHRIAGRVGLVSAGAANFKKAIELTERLRQLNEEDPVRYDFALCALGKLGHCEKTVNPETCLNCLLKEFCENSS